MSGGADNPNGELQSYIIGANSSALMESGLWAQDAVERQMSHQERNSVRAAYIHKAEYLDARKAMMQWWSDYLDMCRKAYTPPYICGKEISCTMG